MSVWFLVSGVALVTAGATPAVDVKAEVRRICHAVTDSSSEDEALRSSAEALGEEGRKAFVGLVRGRRPEATCGLNNLVELKDRRAVPLIREILKDRKANVWLKQAAVAGAGAFQDSGSFDGVLEAFRSGNSDLVGPAAIALGALRDERGLRVLREALDGDLRFVVVTAVGFQGHVAAVEPLMRLMGDPVIARSRSARYDLALSLARIGTPKSRDAAATLLEALEDGNAPGSHKALLNDLFEVFVHQRRSTQDPAELADINKILDRLRADPEAAPWMKTYR